MNEEEMRFVNQLLSMPDLPDLGPIIPLDPRPHIAHVRYPDGTNKTFDVDYYSKGSELFDKAAGGISDALGDRKYFLLCFYDPFDGARHWLTNSGQITYQLKSPEIMRRLERRQRGERDAREPLNELPWNFSFELKFYPKTAKTLVDDLAKHYLLLQLEREVLSGQLPTSVDTYTLLNALLLQLTFGDSQAIMCDKYSEAVAPSKLNPNSLFDPSICDQIVEKHKQLIGITTPQALNQFFELCIDLPFYGLQLFSAKDSNQQEVVIGLGTFEVKICQNGNVIMSFPLDQYNLYFPNQQVHIGRKDRVYEDDSVECIFDDVEHLRLIQDLYFSFSPFYQL